MNNLIMFQEEQWLIKFIRRGGGDPNQTAAIFLGGVMKGEWEKVRESYLLKN